MVFSESHKRVDKNGREYTEKMRQHLESVRPAFGENGFCNPDGRPTKEQLVKDYRAANPEASKRRCSRELGLDPKTVRKWWDK